jgi:P-loop containing dynein motor region
MLTNTMPPEYDSVLMTFSARTSANQTQDIIDGKMDKRRKGIFGPPAGKRFIIFVDDFNMPQREKYFAQPPLEVLRQWLDHSGWYERKPPCAFKTIIDSQACLSHSPVPATWRACMHTMRMPPLTLSGARQAARGARAPARCTTAGPRCACMHIMRVPPCR